MSQPPVPASGLDRRTVLRRIGLSALIAGPGVSLLGACATSGGSARTVNVIGVDSVDPENPFGVKPGAPLDVVIFRGGFGDAYATQVHEPQYLAAFPGAKIKHEAIVSIGTALQPRFTGGTDVPDVVDNSGTDLMDQGILASGDQMEDLTNFWEAPSVDDPAKRLKDIVLPSSIEYGFIQGKPYIMPYTSETYGLWYNAKLFQKSGWTPPRNFTEFTALCERIKAAGITPFAYAGKNGPTYMYWMILISAAKIGGNQILVDIDNLKDGAWTADPVRQSAAAWAQIGQKYSDKSYLGLIHTEVQARQNQDKLAFYPSGDWLENEQKKSTPATFTYALTPVPSVTAADKMPFEAIRVSPGENFFVAAQGANPAGGLEYLRRMLSKSGARGFYQKAGAMTIVKGALDGLTLSPGAQSVVAAQQAAGANIVTYNQFESWYKELETELRNQTNLLMYGGSTAEAFCANMQRAADKTKTDSSIAKQTRTNRV
jgi:N-acetylglucosamine transport system substrate-binding protein